MGRGAGRVEAGEVGGEPENRAREVKGGEGFKGTVSSFEWRGD